MELKTRNRLKVAAIATAAVLGTPIVLAALFAPMKAVPEPVAAHAAPAAIHATQPPADARPAPKYATAPRPEVRATLGTIAREFGEDPDEAGRTYAEARVITLGVLQARSGSAAAGFLVLGTPENPRAHAQANLADGEWANATRLKRGAIVAIECQSAAEGWDALVLDECRVIKPGAKA